jgi:hypothetical protein
VQIPVSDDNMGDSFKPIQPPIKASPESKLRVVQMLTDENELILDQFFKKVSLDITNGIELVQSSAQVDDIGKVCAKYSRKTEESILLKAKRPGMC